MDIQRSECSVKKSFIYLYIVKIIKKSSFGSILIYRGYYTAMQRCEFYFLSGEVLFLTWQDINFNSSSHLLIFILLYGETDVCTSNSGKVENDFINIFKVRIWIICHSGPRCSFIWIVWVVYGTCISVNLKIHVSIIIYKMAWSVLLLAAYPLTS